MIFDDEGRKVSMAESIVQPDDGTPHPEPFHIEKEFEIPAFPELEEQNLDYIKYGIGRDANERINNITEDHMRLVEDLLYGRNKKGRKLFKKLSKNKKLTNKLKVLSKNDHVDGDQKLSLWYLTPIRTKMDMIQQSRNNILARIMSFMLLEEIHNTPALVLKLEKHMDEDYKGQLYMFFLLFANLEATATICREIKREEDECEKYDERDLAEFIDHLEKQLESTDKHKQDLLEVVNVCIEEEGQFEVPEQNEEDEEEEVKFNITVSDFTATPTPKLRPSLDEKEFDSPMFDSPSPITSPSGGSIPKHQATPKFSRKQAVKKVKAKDSTGNKSTAEKSSTKQKKKERNTKRPDVREFSFINPESSIPE
jgi:hypothetical protein